jgi:hypothetical protein
LDKDFGPMGGDEGGSADSVSDDFRYVVSAAFSPSRFVVSLLDLGGLRADLLSWDACHPRVRADVFGLFLVDVGHCCSPK